MLWRTRVRWQFRHVRDRARKWCDQHEWCARFWGWWTGASLPERPASYSRGLVRNTTTLARWLAGLSGAAMVLSFAFYMQAYLSILSIKDDCVSRRFVADAIGGAVQFLDLSLLAGVSALAAIVWPVCVGAFRNRARRKWSTPPLQSGHEFDGWSENRVRLCWLLRLLFMSISAGSLITLIYFLLHVGGALSTPEGIQEHWHCNFEVGCLPPESVAKKCTVTH